jgi:hypothetical protein
MKKETGKNIIAVVVMVFLLLIAIGSLMLMEGQRIVSLAWREKEAIIVEKSNKEQFANTKYKGTLVVNHFTVKVVYTFEGKEYTSAFTSQSSVFKSEVDKIIIRVNPDNPGLVMFDTPNWTTVALLGFLSIVAIVSILSRLIRWATVRPQSE